MEALGVLESPRGAQQSLGPWAGDGAEPRAVLPTLLRGRSCSGGEFPFLWPPRPGSRDWAGIAGGSRALREALFDFS